MSETGSFDTIAYLQRCIGYGWGINHGSSDWEKLSPADKAYLESLEAQRHPGWQEPLRVDTDPFALLTNWVHQSALHTS